MSKSITFPVSEDLYGLLVDAAWAADMGVSEFVAFKLDEALTSPPPPGRASASSSRASSRNGPTSTRNGPTSVSRLTPSPWDTAAQCAMEALEAHGGEWLPARDLLSRLVRGDVLSRDTTRFPGGLGRLLVNRYGARRRVVNGRTQYRFRSVT